MTEKEKYVELWFDVERRYKTIFLFMGKVAPPLWFDVERRYKTICSFLSMLFITLWFDVERRYKTIRFRATARVPSCGLM